jgi:RhoGEF domain
LLINSQLPSLIPLAHSTNIGILPTYTTSTLAHSHSHYLSHSHSLTHYLSLSLVHHPYADLFAVNYKFFQALLVRLAQYKNDYAACKIGDVFIDHADTFLVYTNYVNRFDSALEVLQRNQANPKFSKFLKQIMQEGNIPLDLGAYLINPVQRLPRYELLLREVVKHTAENHADYKSVNEAQATLKEVNERINQSKRDEEMRSKVRQLHSMMWSDMCMFKRDCVCVCVFPGVYLLFCSRDLTFVVCCFLFSLLF